MKALLILVCALMSNCIFAQVEVVSAFIEKWDNSRDYLVAVAQAMPEDKYDYKPTEREMSFREQLFHIQENMNWLSTTHFSEAKYVKIEVDKELSKDQVISNIIASFDDAKARIQKVKEIEFSQKVDFFAGPITKLQILNLLQDHVTHHRGGLIVYLNLNNVVPPKYVGW